MRIGGYVQKRRDIYRFRFRFPRSIASRWRLGELVLSLRTASRVVAVQRARALRVDIDTLLEKLEMAPSEAEANALVRSWVQTRRQNLLEKLDTTGCIFFTPEEVQRSGAENLIDVDCLLRFCNEDAIVPDLELALSRRLSGLSRPIHPVLDNTVANAFSDLAPQIDPQSVDGARFRRIFLEQFRGWIREEVALSRGESRQSSDTIISNPVPSTPAQSPSPSEFVFLSLWDDFAAYKVRERQWKIENLSNSRSSRNLFHALHPDVSVFEISRDTIEIFRASLLDLPRDYDKRKIFREISIPDAIALAKEMKASGQTIEFLSVKTANKHFGNLIGYWKWLCLKGNISRASDNPFTGFIKKPKHGSAARDDRDQWPLSLQQQLFTSPVWSGCFSIHRRSRSGQEIHRDAFFWLPIIGRTSGAREDELCSLRVGDVRCTTDADFGYEAGASKIHYFAICDSKTAGSERNIPVHDLVLRLGFLEYRIYGRLASEPLFPELLPQGVGQSRAAAFSSRFTEYRKKIGAYRAKVGFHSFRHNMSTDMGNMPGLNAGWADEITGHTSHIRASVRTLYTKGVLLRNLQETVNKIRFPVDISHLYYKGTLGVSADDGNIPIYVKLAQREMAKKAGRPSRKRQGA